MSPTADGPKPALSVRTIFVATLVAIGLYVVAIGGYILVVLTPSAGTLQSRTTEMGTEYDSIGARSHLLRNAVVAVRELSLEGDLSPASQQRAQALRIELGKVAEQAAGVQANMLLNVPPAMRVVLADAAGAESGLAGSLVVALDYLNHGDAQLARDEVRRAEASQGDLAVRLDSAQRLGLASLAEGERLLGVRARRVTGAIELWLVLGLLVLALLSFAAHRRFYLPLAALDAGLARVAAGNLETRLPVARNDEFGRLGETFNQMTDVLRTRTEVEGLRLSELRFRTLIEQAPAAIFVSRDGAGLYANRAFAEMFALRQAEDVIGQPLVDYYAPQCREERRERAQRFKDGLLPVPDEFESTGLRSDGSQFSMEVTNAPTVLPDGPAIVSFITDITERKRAEEALRASESQHRTILFTAMDGFWRVNEAGRLTEVNEAYCRMSGYTEQELVGMPVADLDANESHDEVLARQKAIMEAGEARFESRHRRKDGSTYHVAVSIKYRPEDGTGFVGFVQDITARKEAEAVLQRLLLDKEALLKEVHHRVKNNLQLIASLLHLESARSAEAETKTVLQGMHGRIRSIARLHESLTHAESHSSVDLGGYLKELSNEILAAAVTSPSSVKLRLDLASVRVPMDRAMPCGLLVNELVTNSIKHGFPDGRVGEVRVELRPVANGSQLLLRVSDNGVGLPPQLLLKQGTSLGLQLVSDLVKQLHGTLEIDPAPGAGAAFTVTFPATSTS